MAQQLTIGNEVFKKRNPVAVWIGLPLITLGVYYFVWYYKINNEAKRYLRDPSMRPGMSLLAVTLGWIIIVPPFVSLYRTGVRVQRMQANAAIQDRCEPWINLILSFFFSLDRLYLQINLNKLWDAYLSPGAGAMPTTQALPPPPVPPAAGAPAPPPMDLPAPPPPSSYG